MIRYYGLFVGVNKMLTLSFSARSYIKSPVWDLNNKVES